MCASYVKKWSPYLSMGRPHVHVEGGTGYSDKRNFLWMKILNFVWCESICSICSC